MKTKADVWFCGEECGCTQPRIEGQWTGTMRTDFAEGADLELAAKRDSLDPVERERIEWPDWLDEVVGNDLGRGV